MRRAALLALLAAAAAGCGDGDEAVVTTTVTTTPRPARESSVLVYFLRDGKVAAARRSVRHTGAAAGAAVRALIAGPTPAEARAGLATAIPSDARLLSLSIRDRQAFVRLTPPEVEEDETSRRLWLAQVVYTLTQFPTVDAVVFEDEGVTRADLEGDTPAILVESPAVWEAVRSPIRVRGTANTFEANFTLRLVVRGRKVAERFVTATSGTGTRGTFDTTIAVPAGVSTGRIMLVAFEPSAADGRPTNVVRIPLVLPQ